MADRRPRLPRAAKKTVDFSDGGARLPKRKSPDDVPRLLAGAAKRAKGKNAARGSAAAEEEEDEEEEEEEEEGDWSNNEDVQKLIWTHFPHIEPSIPYWYINRSDAKGKMLQSKVDFIPAGKLLWEEESLFQDFPHWRRGANKRESRQEFEDRIEAVLWRKWGSRKRTLFANFSTLSDEGPAGRHRFFGDSKAARIDANAGGEQTNKYMMLAYKLLNFMSHSCRPNCRITDLGHDRKPRWQLRTLVPIKGIGTELTIDYNDLPQTPSVVIEEDEIEKLLQNVEYRQEIHNETYQFQCECEACIDPEATDKARDDIIKLHGKLMADLPEQDTEARWIRLAKDCDLDMERYVDLCKIQHLIPMALQAHERAVTVYTNSNRGSNKSGETEISRSDRLRVKEHSFGQAEMRRLLYGVEDPDLEEPMNKIIEPIQQARAEAAPKRAAQKAPMHRR
ncbi:putative chloride channel protein [Venturia nashicola]|nr:putative chloride channel protein [Venturia nashicola]